MSLTGKCLQADPIFILDFGGGNGKIAQLLARRLVRQKGSTVRISLVDYNQGISPEDSQQIRLERFDTLGEVREKGFDLVVASAILEHIPYARKELSHLLSVLRSGGLFYARTPSVVSIFRVFQRLGLSFDFTYPAHVHDLGQTFWERILPYLDIAGKQCELLWSRPSIVETSFR
jgi:2-polyprenyl-3-methyl-5-hydroxy-6-metoxy-1,4-benzoquinol methylase